MLGTQSRTEPVPNMVSIFTPRWGFVDERISTSQPSSASYPSAGRGVWLPIYVPTVCCAKRMWWANGSTTTRNERQTVTLTDFAGTDSFRLTFGGQETSDIVRGTNCTAVAIKALLEALSSISPNTVTVTWTTDAATGYVDFDNGTLANTDVSAMTVTNAVGCTGSVAETTRGGLYIEAGIYLDAGYKPGAKLITTGEVKQGTATQVQFADITDTWLSPSLYWLYFSAVATTSSIFRSAVAAAAIDELFGFEQASIPPGSAPATATPVEYTSNWLGLMGFSTTTIT